MPPAISWILHEREKAGCPTPRRQWHRPPRRALVQAHDQSVLPMGDVHRDDAYLSRRSVAGFRQTTSVRSTAADRLDRHIAGVAFLLE